MWGWISRGVFIIPIYRSISEQKHLMSVTGPEDCVNCFGVYQCFCHASCISGSSKLVVGDLADNLDLFHMVLVPMGSFISMIS